MFDSYLRLELNTAKGNLISFGISASVRSITILALEVNLSGAMNGFYGEFRTSKFRQAYAYAEVFTDFYLIKKVLIITQSFYSS